MSEDRATTPRTYRERPANPERMRATLDTLIRAKGLGQWAYFFTTVEGIALGEDLEEYSGSVIDAAGHVFDFWMGADPATGAPALTTWQQVEPDPRWLDSSEYRRARRAVGLDA